MFMLNKKKIKKYLIIYTSLPSPQIPCAKCFGFTIQGVIEVI